MQPIEVAVLDLGGTTVFIGDVVERAVRRVTGDRFDPVEFKAMRGASKLDLLAKLLGPDRAHSAHSEFEESIAEAVATGEISPMPGAGEALSAIRAQGIGVCLLTGFSEPIQQSIISAFGWADRVDLGLSPSRELRGRPWPDLILTAAVRLQASHVGGVAVIGDTTNDVEAARRAGAGICAGVLTGAHDRVTLAVANPTHIVNDLAEFVALLV